MGGGGGGGGRVGRGTAGDDGGGGDPPPPPFFVAVSENHVRDNVFDEGEKLSKMFHANLHVNASYDDLRERLLRETVARYKAEGFRGRGLPDTGLFLRRHDAKGAAFSALWVGGGGGGRAVGQRRRWLAIYLYTYVFSFLFHRILPPSSDCL